MPRAKLQEMREGQVAYESPSGHDMYSYIKLDKLLSETWLSL